MRAKRDDKIVVINGVGELSRVCASGVEHGPLVMCDSSRSRTALGALAACNPRGARPGVVVLSLLACIRGGGGGAFSLVRIGRCGVVVTGSRYGWSCRIRQAVL